MPVSTRAELSAYALRRLGSPVINIEVDATQIEDRIDEALQTFSEQHYDATEEVWVSYPLTEADVTSGYITIPEDVLIVSEVRPNMQMFGGRDLFSYQYQIVANELSPWRPFNSVDYFMKMTNYKNIIDLTSVTPTFEFIRHASKLKVHTDLEKLGVGYPFAMKVFKLVDPTTVTRVYNDKWLKAYTTALIKLQWGSNTKKYEGVQLLGGMTMNGKEIYDEAQVEIEKLIEELETRYSEPIDFFMG